MTSGNSFSAGEGIILDLLTLCGHLHPTKLFDSIEKHT
jgi:hypothetical protein